VTAAIIISAAVIRVALLVLLANAARGATRSRLEDPVPLARPDALFRLERSIEHLRHRLAVEQTAAELRVLSIRHRTVGRADSDKGGGDW